jgi:predicted protein tyrosine phosphatase
MTSLTLAGIPAFNLRLAVFSSFEAAQNTNSSNSFLLAQDAAKLYIKSCIPTNKKDAKMILDEFATTHNIEEILNVHTYQDSGVDEFFPNLFISSQVPAHSLKILQHVGITHIINCTENDDMAFPDNFSYLCLCLQDRSTTDLIKAIYTCNKFVSTVMHPTTVQQQLQQNNTSTERTKVLFYCGAGISRSVAVALGYLILEEKLPLQIAFALIKAARSVADPNPSFCASLRILDQERMMHEETESQIIHQKKSNDIDNDEEEEEHAIVEPS